MDFAAKIGPEVDRERLIEELIKLKALISGFFESVPGTFIVLDSQWRLVHIKGDVKKKPHRRGGIVHRQAPGRGIPKRLWLLTLPGIYRAAIKWKGYVDYQVFQPAPQVV
jgi:hypothetical protein